MSILITVAVSDTAKTPVPVLVQSIKEDGRERHPNGMHAIEPGTSHDFLIDELQCLRVGPEAPAPEPEVAQ